MTLDLDAILATARRSLAAWPDEPPIPMAPATTIALVERLQEAESKLAASEAIRRGLATKCDEMTARDVERERDALRDAADHTASTDEHCSQGVITRMGMTPDQMESLKRDAARYRRLRVLGCAPYGTAHLDNGTVICFSSLDDHLDADIKAHPSRGDGE